MPPRPSSRSIRYWSASAAVRRARPSIMSVLHREAGPFAGVRTAERLGESPELLRHGPGRRGRRPAVHAPGRARQGIPGIWVNILVAVRAGSNLSRVEAFDNSGWFTETLRICESEIGTC